MPRGVRRESLKELVERAESRGWEVALYGLARERVRNELMLDEDERVTDWRYLVPLRPAATALVVGCGWGAVPVTVARSCRRVCAVDSVPEKVAFLDVRRRQQRVENLHPMHVESLSAFPFADSSFDVISLRESQLAGERTTKFSRVASEVHRLLRPNGVAYLTVGNRWSLRRLTGGNEERPALRWLTVWGYWRSLRRVGFTDIEVYACLPHHNGIPLISLPLDDGGPVNFFFKNVFSLFDMVSPEAKRAHAVEYLLARAGARVAAWCGLTRLAGLFVSGFSFLARKAA